MLPFLYSKGCKVRYKNRVCLDPHHKERIRQVGAEKGRMYMRKRYSILVGLISLGVCGAITWATWDSSGIGFNQIFNLAFLALMLVIILISLILGFRRIDETIAGLNAASQKLKHSYKYKTGLGELTQPGAKIFEVDYLDRKYQEYLGYLRKTNSPCDIGDYIGEYEINNYTHRRLLEMVPDILTSLGILGTFIGLVLGLRSFNGSSYEGMANSIDPLINGIKVAFVTSIYGISLSLAFSFWLRGALSVLSESLDNFLDKYYLCAVSPTDATAMNHVLSNQKEQIRSLQQISDNVSAQLSETIANNLVPVMTRMDQTLENFTQVVTLQQQDLLERISGAVVATMKQEFMNEFMDLRTSIRETNTQQKTYLDLVTQAQTQFRTHVDEAARVMNEAVQQMDSSHSISADQLTLQQQNMTDFAGQMTRMSDELTGGMADMNRQVSEALTKMSAAVEQLSAQTDRTLEEITRRNEEAMQQWSGRSAAIDESLRQSAQVAAEASQAMTQARTAADEAMANARQTAIDAAKPVQRTVISDLDELTARMDQLIELLQEHGRKKWWQR